MRYWWFTLAFIIGFVALAPARATTTGQLIPSIFATTAPSLNGAGWTTCPTPITWSVDDSRLRPRQQVREEARLQHALNAWGAVTGLKFAFVGRTQLRYDAGSTQLVDPAHPEEQPRHILIAFLPQNTSPLMAGNGLGFASPSAANANSGEILNGKVVLRLDHVRRNSRSAPRELESLYLHELGHIMGLTHASQAHDLMAPIVTTNTTISDLDIRSVQQFMKPCSTS